MTRGTKSSPACCLPARRSPPCAPPLSQAPIVSRLIPTHHLQPSAFFSYTAGLAGPWAGGEMVAPSSWGTSRERSKEGEERGCTLVSAFSRCDPPHRGTETLR